MLRLKKVKVLIFATPPLQNHSFWVPVGLYMGPERRLEMIFMAVANYVENDVLFRALLETFLHLEAPPEECRLRPWGPEMEHRLYPPPCRRAQGACYDPSLDFGFGCFGFLLGGRGGTRNGKICSA